MPNGVRILMVLFFLKKMNYTIDSLIEHHFQNHVIQTGLVSGRNYHN